MQLNTTVLQFGYLLAWLFAILLIIRGFREERLSDKLLGLVLFLLGQELQDYTFGFAGINFLWEELNGFPRYLGLLLGPAVYFYLKSQTNQQFRFHKTDVKHLIPWVVYFVLNLAIFTQGRHFVQQFQESNWGQITNVIEQVALIVSYLCYFYLSLQLYRQYRAWTETQFADPETISFNWFRDFIYIMLAGQALRWGFWVIDLALQLNFLQEWWWNLGLVFVVCYVGLSGYAQSQTRQLVFREPAEKTTKKFEIQAEDLAFWKKKLLKVVEEDEAYLDPELSLQRLAALLKTNSLLLSSLINNHFDKNFNDFINEYRIKEFNRRIKMPENQHLSTFGVALDSGFNSKATFNRAFKKVMGGSPKEVRH